METKQFLRKFLLKMFLFELGISVLVLVVAAVLMVLAGPNIIAQVIMTVYLVFMYLVMPFIESYSEGRSDVMRAEINLVRPMPLKGLYGGLCASIIPTVLYVLYLFMQDNHIMCLIMRFYSAQYLVFTNPDIAGSVIYTGLLLLPLPIVCAVAYYLGVRNVPFLTKIILQRQKNAKISDFE